MLEAIAFTGQMLDTWSSLSPGCMLHEREREADL